MTKRAGTCRSKLIRRNGPRCCHCPRWEDCGCTVVPGGRCARWSTPWQTPTRMQEEDHVSLPRRRGRWRLLMGMVLANRPWRLVPGLKSALVAALATGAVATINSTVWLLAGSLSWWRLVVATCVSIALAVGWFVVDGKLWDRPDDDSPQARERSRLYNASTVVTLTAGVLICYLALYLVNLAWALFVLDPKLMGGYLRTSFRYGDVFVLAWFVASAATVGGGLGSGFDSDEAIRAAAYSKREEERRERLARERSRDRDRDRDQDQDRDEDRALDREYSGRVAESAQVRPTLAHPRAESVSEWISPWIERAALP